MAGLGSARQGLARLGEPRTSANQLIVQACYGQRDHGAPVLALPCCCAALYEFQQLPINLFRKMERPDAIERLFFSLFDFYHIYHPVPDALHLGSQSDVCGSI